MIELLMEKIGSITSILARSNSGVDTSSKDLKAELFENIATHASEAEKQGDDWILLNGCYRRFFVVHSLPSVIDQSVEKETLMDRLPKLPHLLSSHCKQHPTDLQQSRMKHMRRNSVLRSRHRLQSEINNSRTQRSDARWLRNYRMLDHLRDSEYDDVSLYFDLSHPDKEVLDVYTDWILTELREGDIGIEPIRFRNEDALETNSIVGSELIQHRIRLDKITTSNVNYQFTRRHRELNEEYRNIQLNRIEKYFKRNDDIPSENSDGNHSDETQN